ncbi:3-methyl-2-oxobutanoate hydroxymethyltransferase [Pseudobacillus badius]|uniref:3-methyl-2-oxobutanoate hydroxymethyltransferase n=1 Tax=Bacillus badius TaxID=1455 RepID=UPI001CBE7D9D|nr:3-methyl-2-oxobutanoate hydroxymethyltransferase [Bacillus badius]UAT29235.1 3-methyl-2-oxobutanoate hydroxymethyltransferase [Bacillus badius]GLY09774.1 3-methyl-2-oxobutanoate hydroxymethyltransferase [Bacillus badius]
MKQTSDFIKMKKNGEKIAMITAYDYPSAKLSEEGGADILLVGDSLGMVVLGYESTVPVTLDDMIHHTKAVKRGAKETFVVTDLPFMSYHISREETMRAARALMQEAGAHAVKIEGGEEAEEAIRDLTRAGVPTVAHLGLTPQSVGVLGGYKVQGKTAEAARKLLEDAKKLEQAGAFMAVLECVPRQIAAEVAGALTIPVIGIGAGKETDGQVLVYHDLIQYGVSRTPKFVKSYSNVNDQIAPAISTYVTEVKSGAFPGQEHTFTMKEEELEALYGGARS